MQTGLISTLEGPAFIRRIGQGPRLVVFHGGPGFDHEYLVEPLQFLAKRRSLIFYDQPGCGSTPAPRGGPTPEHTYRHANAVLEIISEGESIGVIAHSWGVLVLAGALACDASRANSRAFIEGVLINPTAINRRDYESARQNFAKRIPLSVKARILWALIMRSGGTQIMDLLLPYYSGSWTACPPGSINLNLATYNAINRKLANFNFSKSLSSLRHTTVIRGENDFTGCGEISEFIKTGLNVETIPAAGHFPFHDEPGAFQDAVRCAFDKKAAG